MSDFRKLYFVKTMRNVICLKVCLLTAIQIFHAKKYFYNNSTVKLKSENIKIIRFHDTDMFFKFCGS